MSKKPETLHIERHEMKVREDSSAVIANTVHESI